jgi:hypothetical protein
MGPEHRHRLPRARILAVVTVLASLAAACSGVTTASGSTNYQKAVAFAQCMRTHGMPRWPDPNSRGVFVSTPANRADFVGPDSVPANKACQRLLPNGGVPTTAQQQKIITRGLRFAACMRSHGIPQFPDSGPRGGFSPGELKSLGIDVNSPQFETAQHTCQKLVPAVAP